MNARRFAVAAAAASVIAAGAGSAMAAGQTFGDLNGHGHGTWTAKPSNPDTGMQRVVKGHGHFTIGDATIRGYVTSPGFIASGSCSVSMTLNVGDGSIGVVGHSKRVSPPPNCIGGFSFRFHTVKASGVLLGKSYTGVGHFDLEDSSSSSPGTFTLTLKTSASSQ
jgi:hypothetical protein